MTLLDIHRIVVVFDLDEVRIYPVQDSGAVDHDNDLPWPTDWPKYLTSAFLDARGIKWI